MTKRMLSDGLYVLSLYLRLLGVPSFNLNVNMCRLCRLYKDSGSLVCPITLHH